MTYLWMGLTESGSSLSPDGVRQAPPPTLKVAVLRGDVEQIRSNGRQRSSVRSIIIVIDVCSHSVERFYVTARKKNASREVKSRNSYILKIGEWIEIKAAL